MATEERDVTIGELLEMIDAAITRMATRNPHRWLLRQCRAVIVHLVAQQPDVPVRTRSGLILP